MYIEATGKAPAFLPSLAFFRQKPCKNAVFKVADPETQFPDSSSKLKMRPGFRGEPVTSGKKAGGGRHERHRPRSKGNPRQDFLRRKPRTSHCLFEDTMAQEENCNHNCSGCSQNDCNQRDLHEKLHDGSSVKKVIGIVSGKGGVGKSLVTSLLAAKITKDGYRAAILDADITGPSIPMAFGLEEERAETDSMTGTDGKAQEFLKPVQSKGGVQIMSMNFLLPHSTDPVIWRGPVISGAVRQFWTDVVWDNVDFMFVDCPPGTGDVPLTVFQSIPVDGIIVVSSPQQLVRVIVEKAVNMANMMHVPILGLIENMSYVRCPDCGKELNVFGESNINRIAEDFSLKVLARIPVEQKMSVAVDNGEVESLTEGYVDAAAAAVEGLIRKA